LACEKFIAQTGVFIAQIGDLSLRLSIYRSKPMIYRSDTSHTQVNLVRRVWFFTPYKKRPCHKWQRRCMRGSTLVGRLEIKTFPLGVCNADDTARLLKGSAERSEVHFHNT